MTRFEALGVLPDKPELTAFRWEKEKVRYIKIGRFPMEAVVDMLHPDGSYKLQTGSYQKKLLFVVKVSVSLPGGGIGKLWLKADNRKVRRNKKRFGWKFKSDKTQ